MCSRNAAADHELYTVYTCSSCCMRHNEATVRERIMRGVNLTQQAQIQIQAGSGHKHCQPEPVQVIIHHLNRSAFVQIIVWEEHKASRSDNACSTNAAFRDCWHRSIGSTGTVLVVPNSRASELVENIFSICLYKKQLLQHTKTHWKSSWVLVEHT